MKRRETEGTRTREGRRGRVVESKKGWQRRMNYERNRKRFRGREAGTKRDRIKKRERLTTGKEERRKGGAAKIKKGRQRRMESKGKETKRSMVAEFKRQESKKRET